MISIGIHAHRLIAEVLLRKSVNECFLVLPPTMTLASVILDNALYSAAGLGMQSRICQSLLALVAGELDARNQSKRIRVIQSLQCPMNTQMMKTKE